MATLGDILSGRVYAYNVNVWEPSLQLLLAASRVASGPFMPHFFGAALTAIVFFYEMAFRQSSTRHSFLRQHLKEICRAGGERLARLVVAHIALFFPRNEQNQELLGACSLSPSSLLTRVTQAMGFDPDEQAIVNELQDRSADSARYGVYIATAAYNQVTLQPGYPPIDQAYAFMRSLHEAYGCFLEQLAKKSLTARSGEPEAIPQDLWRRMEEVWCGAMSVASEMPSPLSGGGGDMSLDPIGTTQLIRMPETVDGFTRGFLVYVSGKAVQIMVPLWDATHLAPVTMEHVRQWGSAVQGVVLDGYFLGRVIAEVGQQEEWIWASSTSFMLMYPHLNLVRGDGLWREMESAWGSCLREIRNSQAYNRGLDVLFPEHLKEYQRGERNFGILACLARHPNFGQLMRSIFMMGVAVAHAELELCNKYLGNLDCDEE